MQVPTIWTQYPAEEYFAGDYPTSGVFDAGSQNYLIVPLSDVYENTEIQFLAIGRSGGDGIDFGYRRGMAGIWAYYPIDKEFKFMAPSVKELVDKW